MKIVKIRPGFDPALYPKFRNADGTLTGYAFACGYVEIYGEKTADPSATVSREPNGFHVKGFNRAGAHFWEIFPTAREARRYARRQAGKMRMNRN